MNVCFTHAHTHFRAAVTGHYSEEKPIEPLWKHYEALKPTEQDKSRSEKSNMKEENKVWNGGQVRCC